MPRHWSALNEERKKIATRASTINRRMPNPMRELFVYGTLLAEYSLIPPHLFKMILLAPSLISLFVSFRYLISIDLILLVVLFLFLNFSGALSASARQFFSNVDTSSLPLSSLNEPSHLQPGGAKKFATHASKFPPRPRDLITSPICPFTSLAIFLAHPLPLSTRSLTGDSPVTVTRRRCVSTYLNSRIIESRFSYQLYRTGVVAI